MLTFSHISLHEVMDWPIAQSVIEMVNNQRSLANGGTESSMLSGTSINFYPKSLLEAREYSFSCFPPRSPSSLR